MNYKSITAFLALGTMLVLMLFSAYGDSATMDELAHIPAGFGYVKEHDYRLNPEHPPLIKALSAYSGWLFAKPYFPTNTQAWQKDINGQWTQGAIFLYESGNNADKIIFWSRLPIILLTVFFGFLIFWWTRRKFGENTALLTLILYAFSPTVLAHGRYVTTDLGASFGFFLGFISFLKFIEKPVWKNIFWAGLALGTALLLKFSLVLLLPVFFIIIIARGWTIPKEVIASRRRSNPFLKLFGKTILVGIVAIFVVWGVYYFFNYNYPKEKQLAGAEFILQSFSNKTLAGANIWLIKQDGLRHLGQYVLGFLMVSQRAGGGNTGYFLGEVSAAGWKSYFPVLYLLKEPLALHILTLLALVLFLIKLTSYRGSASIGERIRKWIELHLFEFSSLSFIAVYWASSLASPLNIGVRHVLPTFPFIYILISKQISDWLRSSVIARRMSWKSLKFFAVFVLMSWLIIGTALSFPGFLSYYNELAPLAARAISAAAANGGLPLTGQAGGAKEGYGVAVDSNYDWGQDLRRLKKFVEKNKIEKIAVDYFGGGNPRYYLGEKFEPWWSARGEPSKERDPSLRSGQTPDGVWLAISATFRQGAFGRPVPSFEKRPEDSYEWLKKYEPVARAGESIFIYKIP